MTSLRQAAGTYLGFEAPMTVRQVGADLGRPTGPVRRMLRQLDQRSVEWVSGSLLPSSVKGTATLRLFSDGFYSFEGHVHENGMFNHSWVFSVAPGFVDDDGNAFIFTAKGKVSDSHSSDDFAEQGHDPRIARYWEQLAVAPIRFDLSVTMNIAQMAGKILLWIPNVVAAATVIGFLLFVNQPTRTNSYVAPDGTRHMRKNRG
ncbi:hypothetical protein ACTMSW_18120 [Micromonospora sp. BQ11]|uniref:hypothetical protein n=1 Tax=Micromonospora sp. BQ11 TaxID=3452212 RepID=UPI003F888646